jgi:hypothetical protein
LDDLGVMTKPAQLHDGAQRFGDPEHIPIPAQVAHQLRIVTCPAFSGWQDRLFDPPNGHRA